jgi:hypothetical protein
VGCFLDPDHTIDNKRIGSRDNQKDKIWMVFIANTANNSYTLFNILLSLGL